MTKPSFANGKHDLKRGVDFIGITCVFVCHDGKGNILMHKRSKNCRDEQGRWDCGGGALEHGEAIEDGIKREVKEEYAAEAVDIQFIKIRDVQRTLDDGTPTHWVALDYLVRIDPNQVKNNEPYKIDEIGWFTLSELPSPLHTQVKKTFEGMQTLGII